MSHICTLPNGKQFSTDDVKCPICGKTMEIDRGEWTTPEDELTFRPRPRPFCGTVIDHLTKATITMKCHDCSSTLKFKDCHITSCIGELF